jgi:endo-1,4-beta-xylanase
MTLPQAEAASGGYNYAHRMRNCDITVKFNGQVVSGATVDVRLIRNHFGFGGSINRWSFDTLGEGYGQAFLKYFDVGTPENEMKWSYVQGDSVKADPSYVKADYLIDFMRSNAVSVRGHNLFWNEKKDWIPKWTWGMNAADFKQAMTERIESAMPYFKGKVVQWDVINEITHGVNGATPSVTMLDSMSGDPNIFKWILQEARKKDPDSKFVINDYNLIEQYDVVDKFIAKVQPLSSYYDIIGCEGHFGNSMEKSSYEQKINKLAQQLGKKVWLTEVDFTISSNQPAKVEELMRTCFANQNVEGLIFWVWCKRRMWRDNLTCCFVDSLLQETDVGRTWRTVRDEWKTKKNGTTNAGGVFSFNGYQGRYVAAVTISGSTYIDTFYLEPGTGAKAVTLPVNLTSVDRGAQPNAGAAIVRLNGRPVLLPLGADARPLWLSTYSPAGRLVSQRQLTIKNGCAFVPGASSGCRIVRIGDGRRTLYTGREVGVR